MYMNIMSPRKASTNEPMRRRVTEYLMRHDAELVQFNWVSSDAAEVVILEGGYEPARVELRSDGDDFVWYYK